MPHNHSQHHNRTNQPTNITHYHQPIKQIITLIRQTLYRNNDQTNNTYQVHYRGYDQVFEVIFEIDSGGFL